MNPGDIFLSKTVNGNYETDAHGNLKVFLYKGEHGGVRNAYYYMRVVRTDNGEIFRKRDGTARVVDDIRIFHYPEVIE